MAQPQIISMNTQRKKIPFKTEVVQVGPELAQEWLGVMPRNRKLNKPRVGLYAKEMKAGNWVLSGESIKFDEYGFLVDGQTRLNAIIKAGVVVPLMVVWGIPKQAMEVLDSGQPRSISQTAQISGRGGVQTKHIATLRAMFVNVSRTGLSREAVSQRNLLKLYDQFRGSIQFATTSYSSQKNVVRPASVAAPIAKAHWCGENIDLLARFAYILDNGFAEDSGLLPEDKGAILVRNNYLDLRRSYGAIKGGPQLQLFQLKVEYALSKFLAREEVKQLRPATRNLFPTELDEMEV